jgi:ethanolaminephosphotransferase
VPPIFYIYSAITLFLYQTLDAIDGKQARRTGTSSPLGQLFDHGCDALGACLNVYVPMQVLKIGTNSLTYYVYMGGLMTTFFSSNWEEHHTGVLRCSMTICGISSGLTESQWFLIFNLLAEGLTNGAYSQITIKNVAMLLMPDETVFENKFHGLLNSTGIIQSNESMSISE